MKSGGGKNKGTSFERKVCKELSKFANPDAKEDLFWRSAISGGRSTIQMKKGLKNIKQSGDITCIDERGAWLIPELFICECKFYKNLDIVSSIVNRKGKLYTFWKQISKLAKKLDRYPMLIAKQNRLPTLFITNGRGLHELNTFIDSEKTIRPIISSRQMKICLYKEVLQCRT